MGNTLARLGSPERARAFDTSLALNREIAEPTSAAITTLDLAACGWRRTKQRVIDLVRGALPASTRTTRRGQCHGQWAW